MPRVAFADESGTDGHSQCYAIGAVSVPTEQRDEFERTVIELRERHGCVGEAKWTRVRNSHGQINFVLDCLDLVLTSPGITFDAIVVRKSLYRNWQGGPSQQEVAFYKTYTYLLRHIVRRLQDTAHVYIDERSDRYGRRDEAMHTIGNHMLAQLASAGRLGAVTRVRSHDSPGVQLADVLTGAINTGHLIRIQTLAIHPGKHLALERLSAQLGWPHLGHDTYPHPKFNIWHFPQEFRGPSRDPGVRVAVPYATAADLQTG